MEIRPEDLGEARQAGLIRLRAFVANVNDALAPGASGPWLAQAKGVAAPVAPDKWDTRPLGPLAWLWSRGTGLPNATVWSALTGRGMAIVAGLTIGGIGTLSFFLLLGFTFALQAGETKGALICAFFECVALSALCLPGVSFRRWSRKPLTEAEANFLIEAEPETNGLERAFLALVRDAVRSSPPAGETEQTVRQALRALSDALAQLPPTTNHDALTVGASDWQAEADALEAQAQAEADPVIAASLARRADALSRSATSAARSSLLVRRTQALRSELETQTHALRLGLANLHPAASGSTAATNDVNGPAALADLSQLALAVQKVARETANIADARAELDGATGLGAHSYRTSGEAAASDEGAVLRAGVR